jgi:hypothetical protein
MSLLPYLLPSASTIIVVAERGSLIGTVGEAVWLIMIQDHVFAAGLFTLVPAGFSITVMEFVCHYYFSLSVLYVLKNK